MDRLAEFEDFRQAMNDRILDSDNLTIKRFFALDDRVYQQGHLDTETKEMLGLAASMVLRCDDCITYHLRRCRDVGLTTEEVFEVFAVALVVGGSIVIPHLRRAVQLWDQLCCQRPGQN